MILQFYSFKTFVVESSLIVGHLYAIYNCVSVNIVRYFKIIVMEYIILGSFGEQRLMLKDYQLISVIQTNSLCPVVKWIY